MKGLSMKPDFFAEARWYEQNATKPKMQKVARLLIRYRLRALRAIVARVLYPRVRQFGEVKTFWGERTRMPLWDQNVLTVSLYGGLLSPEQGALTWLGDNIGADDVFFDCGANYGVFSGWVNECSPTTRIAAFEPNPAVRETLTNWLGLRPSVEIVPLALAAEPGHATLLVPHWHSGGGSISTSGNPNLDLDFSDGSTFDVQVVTLDSFVASFGRPPTIMKIDVEGSESLVLLGGIDMLTNAQPKIIMEIHYDTAGEPRDSYRDAIAVLTDLRYKLYSLDHDGQPVPHGEATERARKGLHYENILFMVA
jgi:FkbM family methyltransferase